MRRAWPWLALALAACGRARAPVPQAAPVLAAQQSGVAVVLQAVSGVSDDVAWVSGHGAAVLRTVDGGAHWRRVVVPGAEADSLQFRDVAALDADRAFLLAAGPGARSRIYRTDDGGATWTAQFVNADPDAFYDCLAFWDSLSGAVVSDAVDGRLVIRTTMDGGARWDRIPDGGVPAALEGEGAFAASGTCLVALGDRLGWIAAAGPAGSRVYRTVDRGRSWLPADVPLVAGAASGAASVAFRDSLTGVVLGGRIAVATDTANQVAVTHDGGVTWARAGRPPFPGAVFGSAYVPDTPLLVAAGPGGLAFSRDDGATWHALDGNAYWAVGFASPRTGWAVGPGGRITRITLEDR